MLEGWPSVTDLAQKKCVPCRGDVPPLTEAEIRPLLEQLNGWEIEGTHHIYKQYGFDDYAGALAFVNQLSEVAESEGHHPEVWFTWGKVRVTICTHKIDGLTESDFVLAAKIDALENASEPSGRA